MESLEQRQLRKKHQIPMTILRVINARIVSEHPSLESAISGLRARLSGYYDKEDRGVNLCIDGTEPDPVAFKGYTFGCFAAFSPEGVKRVGGTFAGCAAVPPEEVPKHHPGKHLHHREKDLRITIQLPSDQTPKVKALVEKKKDRLRKEREKDAALERELEELMSRYTTEQLIKILKLHIRSERGIHPTRHPGLARES